MNRRQALRSATLMAYRLRKKHGIGLDCPVCPVDVMLSEGLEVWYKAVSSLEGAYIQNSSPASVLLTSLRPRGRVNFTAAHELGHHLHGHGTQLDEYLEDRESVGQNLEETIANTFASFLLMPERAVHQQAKARSISFKSIDHIQTFKLACLFGVGYSTIVDHLAYNLKVISPHKRQELRRFSPKRIKQELGLETFTGELIWVDAYWSGIPVDIRTGDLLISEIELSHHSLLEKFQSSSSEHIVFTYLATKKGIGQVCSHSKWNSGVRVSPTAYTGRALYRHFPDGEDE